jgi:hypothetical protein
VGGLFGSPPPSAGASFFFPDFSGSYPSQVPSIEKTFLGSSTPSIKIVNPNTITFTTGSTCTPCTPTTCDPTPCDTSECPSTTCPHPEVGYLEEPTVILNKDASIYFANNGSATIKSKEY